MSDQRPISTAPTVEQTAKEIIGGVVFLSPEQRQERLEGALRLLARNGLESLEKMADHVRRQTVGSCERRTGV